MLSATQVEPIKPMKKQFGRLTRQATGFYQPNQQLNLLKSRTSYYVASYVALGVTERMSDEEVKARYETKLARLQTRRQKSKEDDKNQLSANYRNDMRDMRQ